MIRKLLCWLGFHEWNVDYTDCCTYPNKGCAGKHCNKCEYFKKKYKVIYCKHCGKVKR